MDPLVDKIMMAAAFISSGAAEGDSGLGGHDSGGARFSHHRVATDGERAGPGPAGGTSREAQDFVADRHGSFFPGAAGGARIEIRRLWKKAGGRMRGIRRPGLGMPGCRGLRFIPGSDMRGRPSRQQSRRNKSQALMEEALRNFDAIAGLQVDVF